MNNIDKIIRKYRNTLLGLILLAIFTWLIERILDWLAGNYSEGFSHVLRYRIDMPILGFAISLFFIWILFRLYHSRTINRRKLKITKAMYGANSNFLDITSELNNRVVDNHLAIIVDNNIAGDPSEGVGKSARIEYEYSGEKRIKKINEGQVLDLP